MFYRISALLLGFFLCIPAFSQTTSFSSSSFNSRGEIYAHGDFNRDGREDLINSDAGGFNVILSNGDGSYASPVHYSLPNSDSGGGYIVTADFNSDGKLDLAVMASYPSYFEPHRFYLYFGRGDGSFQAPITYNLPKRMRAIAAADVNRDNKTDLVILTEDASDNDIAQSYLANGDGGFSLGPATPGVWGYGMLTGDFDGDGKTDIFTGECGFGSCPMLISYGDGTGAFASHTNTVASDTFFVVADLNGDGKSDILGPDSVYTSCCGDIAKPLIQVFYGQADRTFQETSIDTSNCAYFQVAVADFNGDRIPDIIVTESSDCEQNGPYYLAYMPGKGDGTFGAEQRIFDYSSKAVPDLVVVRANRDTKPDLVFTQSSSTATSPIHELLQNHTSGSFPTCNPSNSNTFGINVCHPTPGSTVTSPVRFAIAGTGDTSMRKAEVWVDGTKMQQQLAEAFSNYSFLDANLPLSSGTHNITLSANGWDNSSQTKSFTITVGSGTSSCSAPTSYGIHVCSPANGSTVSSPVAINATANVSGTIYRFELWNGSTKLASVANSTVMQTSVNVPSGTRTLTFVAKNTSGTGCGTTKCTQSVAVTVN